MNPQTKTSDVLVLTDAQKKKSMTAAYVAACLMITALVCLTGNVLTLAAIKLGAGEVYIGMLSFASAIPLVAQMLTLSAMEKYGKRKIIIFWGILSIPFTLPIVFIPQIYLATSSQFALLVLLVATLFWRSLETMGGTAWFPILQDIIPEEDTGKFFGTLRTYWQTAWLITLLVIAFILRKNPTWWQFQIVFAIGLFAFTIRPLFLLSLSELPPDPKKKKQKIHHRFKSLFTTKETRLFVFYAVSYAIPLFIAEPFKIKLLKDLGYSDSFIMLATATLGLGAIMSLKFWGNLADKFGNRSIFSISHTGIIIVTLLWVIVEKSTSGTILVLMLFLFSSIFNSANGIAQTRYMLHAVPKNKQYYIPLITIIFGISVAIAPAVGGLLLYYIGDYRFASGGLNLNNYQILFVISATLFLIPHSLRKSLRPIKETSTRNVIAIVTRPLINAFGMNIGFNKSKQSDNPN